MSSADLTELIAYRKIVGPFGEQRGDLRMGIALSTYLNSKQDRHHFAPAEFMPFAGAAGEDEDGEEMTPEEQIAYVRKLNALLGGREVKG